MAQIVQPINQTFFKMSTTKVTLFQRTAPCSTMQKLTALKLLHPTSTGLFESTEDIKWCSREKASVLIRKLVAVNFDSMVIML